MAISYARFKAIFGDLGITEWVKYNWLSNAGTARAISNEVIEAGYEPLAYVNDGLYNHVTKSINIWDEEWEVGTLDEQGELASASSSIVSLNYIDIKPSSDYYFKVGTGGYLVICYYDIDKTFIERIYGGDRNIVYTSPSNAYYVRFSVISGYGTTYNHDICINESNPYINGNYFPYFEGEKFLVLVGEYTFTGNETWGTWGKGYITNVIASVVKRPPTNATKANIIFPSLVTTDAENIFNNGTSGIAISAVGNIMISASDYTNVSNLTGKTIEYQLATPVLVDLSN